MAPLEVASGNHDEEGALWKELLEEVSRLRTERMAGVNYSEDFAVDRLSSALTSLQQQRGIPNDKKHSDDPEVSELRQKLAKEEESLKLQEAKLDEKRAELEKARSKREELRLQIVKAEKDARYTRLAQACSWRVASAEQRSIAQRLKLLEKKKEVLERSLENPNSSEVVQAKEELDKLVEEQSAESAPEEDDEPVPTSGEESHDDAADVEPAVSPETPRGSPNGKAVASPVKEAVASPFKEAVASPAKEAVASLVVETAASPVKAAALSAPSPPPAETVSETPAQSTQQPTQPQARPEGQPPLPLAGVPLSGRTALSTTRSVTTNPNSAAVVRVLPAGLLNSPSTPALGRTIRSQQPMTIVKSEPPQFTPAVNPVTLPINHARAPVVHTQMQRQVQPSPSPSPQAQQFFANQARMPVQMQPFQATGPASITIASGLAQHSQYPPHMQPPHQQPPQHLQQIQQAPLAREVQQPQQMHPQAPQPGPTNTNTNSFPVRLAGITSVGGLSSSPKSSGSPMGPAMSPPHQAPLRIGQYQPSAPSGFFQMPQMPPGGAPSSSVPPHGPMQVAPRPQAFFDNVTVTGINPCGSPVGALTVTKV